MSITEGLDVAGTLTLTLLILLIAVIGGSALIERCTRPRRPRHRHRQD